MEDCRGHRDHLGRRNVVPRSFRLNGHLESTQHGLANPIWINVRISTEHEISGGTCGARLNPFGQPVILPKREAGMPHPAMEGVEKIDGFKDRKIYICQIEAGPDLPKGAFERWQEGGVGFGRARPSPRRSTYLR